MDGKSFITLLPGDNPMFRLLIFPAIISLSGKKNFSETNTLAYFSEASMTKKFFITLRAVAYAVKF